MAKKKNENLEKAKKGLKTIGNKIKKGSKKLYSLAELSTKKAKLNADNDKALKKIGALEYSKGGLKGKSAEQADKIKENKKQIRKLNAQIKRLKESK
mgnify:CR=1 FL=1